MSRAVYEARIMHGLIGESFSYMDLVSACKARLQQQEKQASEFLEIANLEAFPKSPSPTGPVSREKTAVAGVESANPRVFPDPHGTGPLSRERTPAAIDG